MANINSIIEPDLSDKLDEVSIVDRESKDAEFSEFSPQATKKDSSQEGEIKPVVKINTNMINSNDLLNFKLDINGFIPVLSLTISDINDKMSKLDFPRDGDVVSIYIRPKLKEHHRAIRADFDIRNVKSIKGRINTYQIDAIMKIPNLFADRTLSFSENTSFEHLMDIVEDLGIGFASNIDSTQDPMKRFMAKESAERFIKDVTLQSYKDDNSFFTSFIDQYYYLNFVELNQQFDQEKEVPEIMSAFERNYNQEKDLSPDAEKGIKRPLILTSSQRERGTDLFIESWGLNNNTAHIWLNQGYKKEVEFFDQDVDRSESFLVDPLTTPGTENNKILLKGRKDEDRYKNQIKKQWMGKQPGGSFEGTHDNYQFAKILNIQNLNEIRKMSLTIELSTYNTNLYRYQRVKVAIYDDNDYTKQGQKQRDEKAGSTDDNGTPNNEMDYEHQRKGIKIEFLSGFYVISEISYIYDRSDRIKQVLKLIRREWPIPGNVDQPQI